MCAKKLRFSKAFKKRFCAESSKQGVVSAKMRGLAKPSKVDFAQIYLEIILLAQNSGSMKALKKLRRII